MQYGFYKYALLVDLLWVAGCWKSIYQEIKKSCNVTVWSIIVKDHWSFATGQVSSFIDRRSWNSECPGLWYELVFELTS